MPFRCYERLNWEPKDDSTAKTTGRSLLLYATVANDVEAVRMLLQERGPADINTSVKNPDKCMGQVPALPLHIAMTFGSFDLVKQLLDARANPEQRKFDPLMVAAISGGPTISRHGWTTSVMIGIWNAQMAFSRTLPWPICMQWEARSARRWIVA